MITIEELYDIFKTCDAVSTDSREVKPLSDKGKKVIFFALKGENFDGNKFVISAIGDGATYAVTDNSNIEPTEQILFCDDVLETMSKLANFHRKTFSHPFLAVTGSNGKTTTKELLLAVLSKKFECYATSGNLNNHIGVPLTLLRMPKDSTFSIVEMGANHRGEIAALCDIAEPNYGLITNIGKAHLEGFGGGDGVKRGKGELFDFLDKMGGTAFYLFESTPLSELIEEHSNLKNECYYIADIEAISANKSTLSVAYNGLVINSNLVGDYNIYNIRAAIAVGEYFGVTPNDIKEGIEGYVPTNNRSQMVECGTNRLVVDAYNANPSSMELSINNFAKIEASKKAIVLGDMKELGKYSLEEHIAILHQLESTTFSDTEIYFVGEEFLSALNSCKFGREYKHFKDAVSIAKYFEDKDFENYTVLIKGSNSIRLSSLIKCF